jgi:hypothetical protein
VGLIPVDFITDLALKRVKIEISNELGFVLDPDKLQAWPGSEG